MKPAVIVVIAVVCLVLVGLGWIYAKLLRADVADDKRLGAIARFEDIRLTRTRIVEGDGPRAIVYPLAGVRASVESAGQLTSRITLTRVALTGVFALALRKRTDDRSVFLTIQGPGVAIVREIPVRTHPRVQRTAREFAAAVNAHAQAFEATPQDAAPSGT